jgi:hypothetical protein
VGDNILSKRAALQRIRLWQNFKIWPRTSIGGISIMPMLYVDVMPSPGDSTI